MRWRALWLIAAVLTLAVAIVGTARDSPAAPPPPPCLQPDPITSSESAGSASWVRDAGLPDEPRINTTGTQFGLRLVAPRRGEVGATLYGVSGVETLGDELGFDYRNDGTCTKRSPAIVVTWSDGHSDAYGCATGTRVPAPQDPDRWTRVTFEPREPGGTLGGTPPISDIRIVFDVPLKSVVLDNFRLIKWVIGWPGLSIYVADMGNHRIVRIDNWTASGWVAKWSSFGSLGSGVGQFKLPHDVFVDIQGRIYVADTDNHRIVRMNDMSGTGWTTLGTGACSTTPGSFCRPVSVSVDGVGRIYVAEGLEFGLAPPFNSTNRIVRVNDMNGTGWTQFGAPGSGIGQFAAPLAVRLDAAWRLYVADALNGRAVRIDDMSGAGWQTLSRVGCFTTYFNGVYGLGPIKYFAHDLLQRLYVTTGTTLARFNDISGSGCVTMPTLWDAEAQRQQFGGDGVAVDSAYRIYTTDGHPGGQHRIRRMRDMSGAQWTTYGTRGSGVGQFEQPQGIAVVSAEPSPAFGNP